MRHKQDVMRMLEQVSRISEELKELREKHVLGDGLNVEINRLFHLKSQYLRNVGLEVYQRFLENDTIVRINKSL